MSAKVIAVSAGCCAGPFEGHRVHAGIMNYINNCRSALAEMQMKGLISKLEVTTIQRGAVGHFSTTVKLMYGVDTLEVGSECTFDTKSRAEADACRNMCVILATMGCEVSINFKGSFIVDMQRDEEFIQHSFEYETRGELHKLEHKCSIRLMTEEASAIVSSDWLSNKGDAEQHAAMRAIYVVHQGQFLAVIGRAKRQKVQKPELMALLQCNPVLFSANEIHVFWDADNVAFDKEKYFPSPRVITTMVFHKGRNRLAEGFRHQSKRIHDYKELVVPAVRDSADLAIVMLCRAAYDQGAENIIIVSGDKFAEGVVALSTILLKGCGVAVCPNSDAAYHCLSNF